MGAVEPGAGPDRRRDRAGRLPPVRRSRVTMRVLVVTNMFPPHSYGGYELSCRDVVARWRAAGHEVTVLTSDWTLPEPADRTDDGDPEGGVAVRRVLALYWDDHRILDPSPLSRLTLERRNQDHLRRALAEVRPAVVSAWAMGALSLGLLTAVLDAGLPLVTVICDEWPVYGPHVDGWTRALAHRPRLARLVHLATGLPTGLPPLERAGPACFVSEALRRTCRARSPWPFALAPVTYSGIDRADFPPRDPRDGFSWRLAYVGRIDPRKGIDSVLHALAHCPPSSTLDLVGRGDSGHLAELEDLADRLGLAGRVRFSSASRRGVAATYAAADAVVFPSAWQEPFGLVPVEAMATGTPVVAAATGGAAEFLVDGDNCLLVPPRDPIAIAAALSRLADDPELRARLVAGGHRTADELDVDHLATHLWAWHAWAAAGGHGPPPPARTLPGGLGADTGTLTNRAARSS
jgi:glycogen(starch) synthase